MCRGDPARYLNCDFIFCATIKRFSYSRVPLSYGTVMFNEIMSIIVIAVTCLSAKWWSQRGIKSFSCDLIVVNIMFNTDTF